MDAMYVIRMIVINHTKMDGTVKRSIHTVKSFYEGLTLVK